jgi:hypothetical protein
MAAANIATIHRGFRRRMNPSEYNWMKSIHGPPVFLRKVFEAFSKYARILKKPQ